MGYTHYFTIKNELKSNKSIDALYEKACMQISLMCREFSKKHGGISGFSAHVVPGKYKGVNFNGSKDNGHEPFVLRESLQLNERGNFCKTARKPYDLLVTAALCILYYHLGPTVVDVASDGDYPDWAAGCELASRYQVDVQVPPRVKRTSARHLKVVA
jgi:hypothetical protein